MSMTARQQLWEGFISGIGLLVSSFVYKQIVALVAMYRAICFLMMVLLSRFFDSYSNNIDNLEYYAGLWTETEDLKLFPWIVVYAQEHSQGRISRAF